MQTEEATIRVHREWDGWRNAEVHLCDLEDVHWFQPHGAPHPLLHAFIYCSEIVMGQIPHDCSRAPAPHRLRVCILKKHAVSSVYTALVDRADRKQIRTSTDDAIRLAKNGPSGPRTAPAGTASLV